MCLTSVHCTALYAEHWCRRHLHPPYGRQQWEYLCWHQEQREEPRTPLHTDCARVRWSTRSVRLLLCTILFLCYLVSLLSKNNSFLYKSLLRMYCVWQLISAIIIISSPSPTLSYPILNTALAAWRPRDASVQSLNGHQQESSSTGESGEGKRRIHSKIVSLPLLMALWPWTRQLRGWARQTPNTSSF